MAFSFGSRNLTMFRFEKHDFELRLKLVLFKNPLCKIIFPKIERFHSMYSVIYFQHTPRMKKKMRIKLLKILNNLLLRKRNFVWILNFCWEIWSQHSSCSAMFIKRKLFIQIFLDRWADKYLKTNFRTRIYSIQVWSRFPLGGIY